ncbi:MAG: phosphotransferase family protein [Dehalococcoidia bacterium]|nr:phosphotransferase family protein [Dehalococcoidia bacterium]
MRVEFSLGDLAVVRDWFAARLAPASGVTISEWQRLPFGHSNDTFLVTIESDGGGGPVRQEFVIRRDIVHGIMEPYDIPREFRLCRALNGTKVRAPKVFWLEEDPAVMGAPFYVMERCTGQQPPDLWFMRGFIFEAPPAERRRLQERYLDQLIAVHTLDWRALGLDEMGDGVGMPYGPPPRDGTTDCAFRAIDEWSRKATGNMLEPEPLFVEPIHWLKRHMPKTARVTLTMGDCKLSNFMFRDGEVVGIFDWEWSRLTDPMWDLSWSGFLGNRPVFFLEGMMNPTEVAAYYTERSGIAVDWEGLAFWDAIASLKASSFYPGMARVFQQETSHDLRYGGMGYSTHLSLVNLNAACGLQPAALD